MCIFTYIYIYINIEREREPSVCRYVDELDAVFYVSERCSDEADSLGVHLHQSEALEGDDARGNI